MGGSTLKVILLLLIALSFASAAEDKDLVDLYIGYQYKWYSGYLNFSTGDFHYVFFDSQRDPENDPVVLWLNGGPGCSSLIGLFLQNGPFVFMTNKTVMNFSEFSWNKKANVLYIESPGGVGFSKSLRNNNNTYSDGTTTEDNYQALIAFFRKWKNLVKNEFYISGESYAGIYVPYLAKEILDRNKQATTEIKINLKGILVGNACTDPRECYEPTEQGADSASLFHYQFLNNNNYITDDDFKKISSACASSYQNLQCKRLRLVQDKKFAQTLTVINNIYQPCYHQQIPTGSIPRFLQSRRKISPNDFQSCDDIKGIVTFLNQPSVQIALHVDPRKYFICDDTVADNYKMYANASYWIYPELIKAGLRVWVYSGDVDANVPITGTKKWIEQMKNKNNIPIIEPWRQWRVPGQRPSQDQMAGMVWKLKGFTFVSIKGAGHMVPTDKPKEAQIMLESFLNNQDLPYQS